MRGSVFFIGNRHNTLDVIRPLRALCGRGVKTTHLEGVLRQVVREGGVADGAQLLRLAVRVVELRLSGGGARRPQHQGRVGSRSGSGSGGGGRGSVRRVVKLRLPCRVPLRLRLWLPVRVHEPETRAGRQSQVKRHTQQWVTLRPHRLRDAARHVSLGKKTVVSYGVHTQRAATAEANNGDTHFSHCVLLSRPVWAGRQT